MAKEALDHHFENPIKTKAGLEKCDAKIQAKRLADYRKEMVQVAPVAVQMIECLDRKLGIR